MLEMVLLYVSACAYFLSISINLNIHCSLIFGFICHLSFPPFQFEATTGFLKVPIFSTLTSTTSPGFIWSEPGGVPVAMISPGRSVITLETKLMRLFEFPGKNSGSLSPKVNQTFYIHIQIGKHSSLTHIEGDGIHIIICFYSGITWEAMIIQNSLEGWYPRQNDLTPSAKYGE